MEVTLHSVESERDGWLITLKANLEPSLDREALEKMEDWEVNIQEDYFYLKNYFDLSEPWEDMHLEEIIKAAILEGEWKLIHLKIK